jgi:hypothetical protein
MTQVKNEGEPMPSIFSCQTFEILIVDEVNSLTNPFAQFSPEIKVCDVLGVKYNISFLTVLRALHGSKLRQGLHIFRIMILSVKF